MARLFETLRGRLGVNKSNPAFLQEILASKADIKKAFDPLKEKPVIIKYAFCRNNRECSARHYNEGIFDKLEFYKKTEGRFGVHIWMQKRRYAIGLDDVFDVMLANSVDELAVNEHAANLRNLRIYKFEASAADESEKCSVIHIDPFLAYQSMMKRREVKSGEQLLKEVKPLEAGASFYVYHYHPC